MKLDAASFPPLAENIPGRYRSITEYHALYLSGELTPLAVAESLLPLIRRDISPPSHHATAFTSTNVEAVLEAARASTLRYKEGKPLSILDGIPTAMKDETAVEGYRSTSGCKANDAHYKIKDKSSWPVQKLAEAGVIILGKLNMHELGADTTNNNPNWGTPLNPHNPGYYTGGSSGGSAYVVSAGLVPFAVGADGGGSIRIPSSFCGIYGLKPSHHRLDDTGSTVTVSGPLAGTLSDLEIAYRFMSQPDPSDPYCSLFSPTSIKPPGKRFIGIDTTWWARADPDVLKVCIAALDHYCTSLGYEQVEIQIPYLPQGQLAHAVTILSEMTNRARLRSTAPTHPSSYLSGLNPANKVLLSVGAQTPAQDYLLAQQLRNLLMQHLSHLYQQYPGMIILTPTSPMKGWKINSQGDLKHGITDANKSLRNMEYVWMANFCGNPAISLPAGYVYGGGKDKSKLPVGLMAMGEWGAEDQLLRFGSEGEKYLNEVVEGGRSRPANWIDGVDVEGKGNPGLGERVAGK